MSLRRDAAHAAECAALIDAHLPRRGKDGKTALDRLRDNMAGNPRAAVYDGRVSGAGVSDPTSAAALEALETGDQAAALYREVHDLIGRMSRDGARVVSILAAYTPRKATDAERQHTATTSSPGCQSCSRVEVAKGVRYWSEPRQAEPSTVGGRLPRPRLLCSWCYDHVCRKACLPSIDEVEARRAGKARVPCPHDDAPDPEPEVEAQVDADLEDGIVGDELVDAEGVDA